MSLSLWLSSLHWVVSALGSALLVIDCRYNILLHALRRHKDAVAILYQDCDKWQYQLNSGRTCAGKLIKARSFKSFAVIVLYIQHLRSGRYIVIPRDTLSAKNYRFLAFHVSN